MSICRSAMPADSRLCVETHAESSRAEGEEEEEET